MIYLILALNRKNAIIIASQNLTKRLEICVDINIEYLSGYLLTESLDFL